jgi:serine/threonine protein kinase
MSTGPQRLGKYELQKRLERGGMGEVWKAYDTQLRRYVAIKLLHADLQANPDFVSRFTREAQFVASLHHPNIIQIHDFQFTNTGEAGTAGYMVMDYVEGGTLADYIHATSRKGLFPSAADIVYLFTAISLALDYAHQRGMIHRDIKPANILLDKRNPIGRPEPILTDFGIARLQGAAGGTLTSTLLGTPRYISPEQALGLPGDERTDLYSLGIILYEMVTGMTPFQGDNPIAIMMQHIQEMPTPPILLNANISPALSAVVLQSIAKDPADRFSTASAMTVALARALNVPVPASLNKPPAINGEPNYNPLQPPDLLPGVTFSPTHLIAPSPLAPTQPAEGNIETTVVTPVNRTPTLLPASGYLSRGQSSPISQVPVQPPASPPSPLSPPGKSRRRGLYLALIACIIILLVGTGIGAASLLTLPSQRSATATPNPSGTAVGKITFVSSRGTFDQVQVDLQSIPVPPAGKTYYAWLDNVAGSEATAELHWQLCSDHGVVHCLYPGDSQHSNLLDQNDRFLITEENVGTSPNIPYPTARLYYAQLSHNGLTTFEVKVCPTGSVSNASNPCR